MKLTSYPGHLSFLMSDGGEGVLFVPWACPISERWNALGTRLSSTTWSFCKTGALQSILRISFVHLNKSAEDSCRFDLINKINFYRKTPHINIIIHHILIWFCRPYTVNSDDAIRTKYWTSECWRFDGSSHSEIFLKKIYFWKKEASWKRPACVFIF